MKQKSSVEVRDYLLLALLWFGVNLIPFLWNSGGSYFHWEVVEVRKLFDYGFWARKGALLSPGWYVGLTADPASHNYVNHCYPIVWLYAALYWLFGKAGMYALVAVRSLATVLLTYRFLRHFFTREISGFVTGLVICAHAMIEFTMSTDVVGQGVIVWPLVGLAALRVRDQPSTGNTLLLGTLIFLAGQISWFALSATPALLLLCLPEQASLRQALFRPWQVPGWTALAIGSTASLLVFIGQVLVYTPALQGNAQYLSVQMGVSSNAEASRLSIWPVLCLRMLLAAPALWLGAVVCCLAWRQWSARRYLGRVMLLYFAVFLGIVFTIPRLLFLNQHGHSYMVFPCALMTAIVCECVSRRWVKLLLVAVALPSLLFCYAKLHDFRASAASFSLGQWLADHTERDEFIFTNFKKPNAPVQPWDGEFLNEASVIADRLMVHRIASESELAAAAGRWTTTPAHVSFLCEASQPLEESLRERLERSASRVVAANLAVPPEQPRYFKQARGWLWSLLGKGAPQYNVASDPAAGAATNLLNLRLYRVPPEFLRTLKVETRGVDPARTQAGLQVGDLHAALPSSSPSSLSP